MKHVTVADKSLLVGDEAVDLLVEYATLLGQTGTADSVDLRALGPDGDEVMVTFLLNGGVTIVAETTTSSIPEPDNSKAEQYMHSEIARRAGLQTASPEAISGEHVFNADGGA